MAYQYGCRPNRDPTRWGGAGAPSQVFCAARSWRRGNSLAPSMFDFLGVERPQGAEPKNKTICLWQMVLFLQRTVKIDIFVFGVKGSTAYKTGPSYWMPVSCAGLIFSSGKSFRHHTLSLSIKYETTSTYCFKRDLRNMRFPAR